MKTLVDRLLGIAKRFLPPTDKYGDGVLDSHCIFLHRAYSKEETEYIVSFLKKHTGWDIEVEEDGKSFKVWAEILPSNIDYASGYITALTEVWRENKHG